MNAFLLPKKLPTKKKEDNRIVNKTNDHLVSGSCRINGIMLASCVNMFNHHDL
jgi:hypothetical protein